MHREEVREPGRNLGREEAAHKARAEGAEAAQGKEGSGRMGHGGCFIEKPN